MQKLFLLFKQQYFTITLTDLQWEEGKWVVLSAAAVIVHVVSHQEVLILELVHSFRVPVIR